MSILYDKIERQSTLLCLSTVSKYKPGPYNPLKNIYRYQPRENLRQLLRKNVHNIVQKRLCIFLVSKHLETGFQEQYKFIYDTLEEYCRGIDSRFPVSELANQIKEKTLKDKKLKKNAYAIEYAVKHSPRCSASRNNNSQQEQCYWNSASDGRDSGPGFDSH